MKSLSILSFLTAALLLSAAPVTFGQTGASGTAGGTVSGSAGATVGTGTAAGGTSVSGEVDMSLDANADGTVDAAEQAAGVNAGGGVDLSLDANGDGTVDETEAAAGGNAGGSVDASLDTNGDGTVDETEAAAGGNAGGSVDASLDTDGNGVVSEEEAAAGAAASGSALCSSVDLTVSTNTQAADVSAATNAHVLRLSDCEDGVAGSFSPDVLAALTSNEAIDRVLQQETVSAGEIIGLSVEEQTVLIYVRDDDDADDIEENTPAAQ